MIASTGMASSSAVSATLGVARLRRAGRTWALEMFVCESDRGRSTAWSSLTWPPSCLRSLLRSASAFVPTERPTALVVVAGVGQSSPHLVVHEAEPANCTGEWGDPMTLAGACRDLARVAEQAAGAVAAAKVVHDPIELGQVDVARAALDQSQVLVALGEQCEDPRRRQHLDRV